MAMRQRLDQVMVERGLTGTRSRARDLVMRGAVTVDGVVAKKAGDLVALGQVIDVDVDADRFVARSGLKLEAALRAFGFSPKDLACLDVGASTGGFTQVLIENGAEVVCAVDVGQGQLDAGLSADKRVISMEGVNARELKANMFERAFGCITVDVSFISVVKILRPVLVLGAPGCWLVCLIKPQFEVGREAIGKGGVVTNDGAIQGVVDDIKACISDNGWRVIGAEPSPIYGKDGNREILLGAVLDE